jgi:hypothetical protein
MFGSKIGLVWFGLWGRSERTGHHKAEIFFDWENLIL